MFVVARRILEKIGDNGGELISIEHRDHRLTIGILLYRMVIVDGRIRQIEIDLFREMLLDHLRISDDELAGFEDAVQKCSRNEVPLFGKTGMFGAMQTEQRKHLLAMMRDLSLSDMELHEFEINLLARMAELMGLRFEG